jgi:hypothetical protein
LYCNAYLMHRASLSQLKRTLEDRFELARLIRGVLVYSKNLMGSAPFAGLDDFFVSCPNLERVLAKNLVALLSQYSQPHSKRFVSACWGCYGPRRNCIFVGSLVYCFRRNEPAWSQVRPPETLSIRSESTHTASNLVHNSISIF